MRATRTVSPVGNSAAELQGRNVGSYRVVRLLGAGAMGKVYLLEHARLPNTFAALKVLDPRGGNATLLRERFVQEAMVAAAIGGDRVARPFDVGQFGDGTPYIIMEHVEGRTVAEALEADGPLPPATALVVAYRVADTVALAHARGIVHRDVKPSNIMLTDETQGRIKVLDFGVARAVGDIKIAQTLESAVIGSPGYMSPEAATGMVVDERTDVFSLAVTLFKMLTGELPFAGDNPQATVAAILTRPPRTIAETRPAVLAAVPAALDELMARALHKSAALRPTMAELRDALLALLVELAPARASALASESAPRAPSLPREVDVLGSTVHNAVDSSVLRAEVERFAAARIPPTTREATRSRWPLALAALLGAGSLLLVLATRRPAPAPRPAHLATPSQRQLTTTGNVGSLALAPDGKSVAWVDSGVVSVRELDSDATRVVCDSGGDDTFFSGDGKLLYYTRHIGGTVQTFAMPRGGGPATRTPWLEEGMTDLSHDGRRASVVSYPARSVLITGTDGKFVRNIAIEGRYTWLYNAFWSPGGDRLLVGTSGDGSPIERIVTLDGASQPILPLDHASETLWYDDRTLIFTHHSGLSSAYDLMIQPLDEARLHAAGEPRLVLPQLRAGVFMTSRDGRLAAYLSAGDAGSTIWSVTVGAHDQPTMHKLELGTATLCDAIISPDGTQIAASIFDGKRTTLEIMAVDGSGRQSPRVASCTQLAWSPDGAHLAWIDGESLVVDRAAGGEPKRYPLPELSSSDRQVAWLGNGRVLYHVEGHRQWRILELAGGAITPLTKGDNGWYFRPQVSPDGNLVAVMWNRQPNRGVWLIDTRDGSERFLGGGAGAFPQGWSSDGKLVYVAGEAGGLGRSLRLQRLPVEGGALQPWFTMPLTQPQALSISFARDGRSAVFVERLAHSDLWLIDNLGELVAAAR